MVPFLVRPFSVWRDSVYTNTSWADTYAYGNALYADCCRYRDSDRNGYPTDVHGDQYGADSDHDEYGDSVHPDDQPDWTYANRYADRSSGRRGIRQGRSIDLLPSLQRYRGDGCRLAIPL